MISTPLVILNNEKRKKRERLMKNEKPQPRKKVIKKPKIKTSTIEIRGYIHEMEEALEGTKSEGRKLLGLPIKVGGETMGWICRVDDRAGIWYAKIDVSAEMKEKNNA